MHIHLTNKIILVTGGSSVLGREIVSRARAEGAEVYFTYHKNQKIADELNALGAVGFAVDFTRKDDLEKFKADFKSRVSRLDALVFNAGIVRDKTVGNMSPEEFDEVLQVDLTAPFLLAKYFMPLLFKSEAGKILSVISRVGLRGAFGEANYAAAKAGLAAMGKSLAREIGRKKICINALAPGFMLSAMTEGLAAEVYERNKQDSMLGVLADAGETADFIIYLLSDYTRNVSGQVFCFDSRSNKIF